MGVKINFINPLGVNPYNGLIMETMIPYVAKGTEIVVSSVRDYFGKNDQYYSKGVVEEAILESCIDAEKEGFDAVIVGSCYDTGVKVSRNSLDIPVVGLLEASMRYASSKGHRYVLITDNPMAVLHLRELVQSYAEEPSCLKVDCIDWDASWMIQHPGRAAQDALAAITEIRQGAGADVCILACPVIAACYEKSIIEGATRDDSIINPSTLALKAAQSLAELRHHEAYTSLR